MSKSFVFTNNYLIQKLVQRLLCWYFEILLYTFEYYLTLVYFFTYKI